MLKTVSLYHLFLNLCSRLYFRRITISGGEHIPATGGLLILGLHRNGAVDGFLYQSAVPRAVFLISTQLRKNWFGRLFFRGIALTRAKDADSPYDNSAALDACRHHLDSGGMLFIFPEGTSSLGPRHLPFKIGAAQIFLSAKSSPTVLPATIVYDCPWGFRSGVEIVIGEPFSVLVERGESQRRQLRTAKRTMDGMLERIGINVESDDYQLLIASLASIAAWGSDRSRYSVLKRFEREVPQPLADGWRRIDGVASEKGLARYHGMPLYPLRGLLPELAVWLVSTPFAAVAVALNCVPFFAAFFAASRLADDRNVITLWRILVGIPSLFLWVGLFGVIASVSGAWLEFLLYIFLSVPGLFAYDAAKRSSVALYNRLRFPAFAEEVLAFRIRLLEVLP